MLLSDVSSVHSLLSALTKACDLKNSFRPCSLEKGGTSKPSENQDDWLGLEVIASTIGVTRC